jgi:hypothetical protein
MKSVNGSAIAMPIPFLKLEAHFMIQHDTH